MRTHLLPALLLLVACTGGEPLKPDDTDVVVDTDARDTGGPGDTEVTTDTASPVDTGPPADTDLDCAPGTAGLTCAPCDVGTFCAGGNAPEVPCASTWDDDADPATACVPWSTCPAGTSVDAAGTATADRACTPCPERTWSATPNATDCEPWALTGVRNGDASCAIRGSDGHPVCWGANDFGEASPPDEPVVAVAVGTNRALGIRPDGTLVQWGQSLAGQPGGLYAEVAQGFAFACALDGTTGHPACWGAVIDVTTDEPSTALSGLVVGLRHACGLDSAGLAVCWGQDDEQQVSDAPTAVPFVDLGANGATTCGVRASDGGVQCWGQDTYDVVSTVPAGLVAREVALTTQAACALAAADGEVVCWGDDSRGVVAGAPTTPLATLTDGFGHLCGQSADGRVHCFGRDDAGQVLGAPSTALVTDVAASTTTTCWLDAAGQARCFGDGPWGEGTPPSTAFRVMAAGEELTCGLRASDGVPVCDGYAPPAEALTTLRSGSFACGITQSDGTLACWGNDTFGQIADAPTGDVVLAVDVAQYPGCALDATGQPVCWEEPWDLGVNAPDIPTVTLTSIAAGEEHACGLRASDSHVVCWGKDDFGQQVGVPTGEPFDLVVADGASSCGIRTADGALVCWGADSYGVVSDAPAGAFVDVDLSPNHGCAIRTDQTVTCWGAVVVNP